MITSTRDGHVTILTIEHGSVNASDLQMWTELGEAFDAVPEQDGVLITGHGRAFSAGVDLKRLHESDLDYSDAFLRAMTDTMLRIFIDPRPVVAAINGHAIGAGALLAFSCDLRLMSSGKIALPEFAVGVPVPPVVLEIARYVLGHRLPSLVTSGEFLDPEQARLAGMIDEVTTPEELMPRAIERATRLAAIPRGSFSLTKRLWKEPAVARIREVRVHEQAAIDEWRSDEVRQAIAARVAALTA